jgi:phosphatidate cytidylyltransferase
VSELSKRVLFAVVAAPLAIAAVLLGGASLAALLAIAAAVGAWEFFRIARAAGHAPFDTAGIALAGLVPLVVHAHYLGLWTLPLSVAAVLVLAILAAAIWFRGVAGKPLGAAATTLMGVVYTGVMLSFAYGVRYHDVTRWYEGVAGIASPSLPDWMQRVAPGGWLLLLPLVVTWGSDIGAYFVGRAFGKAKLIPSVSPGKTRAGALGALAASVLLTWLIVRFVLRPAISVGMTPMGIVAFGLAISVAAQVGDLFESLLKRESGVKDSSKLLPGHGGVLDRVDSLLFVLPVAYLLLDHILVYAPAR